MRANLQEFAVVPSPAPTWNDEELVAECLAGNQKAWTALIAKYKALVYSVPMKYRMSREDAADIFQGVWMELYNQLPRLRHPGALRSWLMTVAANQCYHWKLKQRKLGEPPGAEVDLESIPDEAGTLRLREELEREQALREAIQRLPERCRTMIHLLFYSDPPRPYSEVAGRLGLAEGSIGFIRGRCLQKLRRTLDEMGF